MGLMFHLGGYAAPEAPGLCRPLNPFFTLFRSVIFSLRQIMGDLACVALFALETRLQPRSPSSRTGRSNGTDELVLAPALSEFFPTGSNSKACAASWR
jgi:hypothetical protein